MLQAVQGVYDHLDDLFEEMELRQPRRDALRQRFEAAMGDRLATVTSPPLHNVATTMQTLAICYVAKTQFRAIVAERLPRVAVGMLGSRLNLALVEVVWFSAFYQLLVVGA